MKIVLYAQQLARNVRGGIGTYVNGLIKGFSELGHDGFEVAVLIGSNKTKLFEGESKSAGLAELPLVTSLPLGRVASYLVGASLFGIPKGFDIAHGTSLDVPIAVGKIRRMTALSTMVHDLAWREVPDTFSHTGRRFHELALKRVLKQSKLLMVPSSQTADALIKIGVSQDRIEVVQHGCDHLGTPDIAGTRKLLKQLGIKEDSSFLLAVGTLEPRKNLPRLFDAYRLACERFEGAGLPLLVAGPAGWGNIIQTKQPKGDIIFAGEVSSVILSGLYSLAKLLVYVPLLEGFGLPVTEAMAAGTPVVSSPVPAAVVAPRRQALKHTGRQSTRLVDPLDVSSIAQGLIDVVLKQDLRDELIEAGSERVRGLTWKAAAEHHLHLWKGMIE